MIRFIFFTLSLLFMTSLSAQDPCTRCEVMPVLEKYNSGDQSEFARHQLSIASLSQYLTATVKADDGDYTIELLLDEQGQPSIKSYILNGRELTDEDIKALIEEKVKRFHTLNSWIPAEEELGPSASLLVIAFDKKTRPCPDALYGLRSLIQEGPCNNYYCSKSDIVEIFDYYDEDMAGWNYIGDREKESLQWSISYPTKKEVVTLAIEGVPTEEQWEQLKKKLPKKGKIEIERSMYGSDTRYIAIELE